MHKIIKLVLVSGKALYKTNIRRIMLKFGNNIATFRVLEVALLLLLPKSWHVSQMSRLVLVQARLSSLTDLWRF